MNGMTFVLIGAGNVATHLGLALKSAGHQVAQVYSRTLTHAEALAARLGCKAVDSLDRVLPSVDVYVFAIKDSALALTSQTLSEVLAPYETVATKALFLHTAGSMPVDVLPFPHRGVFYPMQTFSCERPVNYAEVPLFIESPTDIPALRALAESLSLHVYELNSEQRRRLHLAAVFACNFANHMYDLSAQVLAEAGINFDVMLPLIDETARKVHQLSPRQAQTGPAVRYDENVMRNHLEMLNDDPRKRQIYNLISQSIHDDQLRP